MGFDFPAWERIVEDFRGLMVRNAGIARIKLSADKWTLNEMIGHLIDSASNNHQRIVRLQLSPALDFPGYEAEPWQEASRTAEYDTAALIEFWYSYNRFLLHLMRNVPEDHLERKWNRNGEAIPLSRIIVDYFSHLELHRRMFEDRVGEIVRS